MKVKKITEVLGLKVFTEKGDYFGVIEEANLFENKVDGWRIKIDQNLASLLGGAKGVIVPHKFVKSMGDVCIINAAAMPSQEADLDEDGNAELM